MAKDSYDSFDCFKIRIDRRVAFVTIDHPPINLFDKALMLDFHYLGKLLEADEDINVAVFDSADKDFFIAHADLEMLLDNAREPAAEVTRPTFFQALVERYRTMPVVSIVKLEGRARGGGSELVLSMDMRFGAKGRAILSQPEVMLGLLPGGSGTQRLPRLMGRSRALEVVLGCDDFDAEMAERYGYINRALPADEIGAFVDRLAYRIAAMPRNIIALAKASTLAADLGVQQGLLEEQRLFNEALRSDEAARLMARCLELGGQTREGEMDLAAMADDLAR